MAITDTVSVSISIYDAAPSVQGFGTIGILATAPYVGEVKSYAASAEGLAAMVTDGFTVQDEAYKMVSAIASQTPHTPSVKVLPRDTGPNAQVLRLDPAFTTAGRRVLATIEYDGTEHDVDVTIQSGDALADIVDDIVTDLGVISGLTITDGGDYLTIATTTPSAKRVHIKDVIGLTLDDTSADAGVATDLAAAAILDTDWYGLLIDSNAATEIAAAGAWALANGKLFGALSVDSDNATADTGVAYALQQLTNHNAYVLVTRDSLGRGDAGLMGRQFAKNPGESTWALKSISGQTPDAWTATEFANLRANGALIYVTEGGLNRTYDGAACSGRFLDIVRGQAWLEARVREAVLAQLVNVERVSYTQQGIGLVDSAISSVLSLGQERTFIASGWSVTTPALSSISAANKANRLLPDVLFAAVLQGGIQSVQVSGTLKV